MAASEAVSVPSGREMSLSEVLVDDTPGETWLRFRLTAPDIAGGGTDPAALQADLSHLCDTLAVPYAAQHGLNPARIVISVADRAVPFGASDAEATQFFELFRPEGARCIWEPF